MDKTLKDRIIAMFSDIDLRRWSRLEQHFDLNIEYRRPGYVPIQSLERPTGTSAPSRVPDLIEDASNELNGSLRVLIDRLMEQLKELDKQVDELDAKIKEWHPASDASRKLEKIPGIGPVTASALIATIGDAKNFDNGRQVAAWRGLAPNLWRVIGLLGGRLEERTGR